MQRGHDTHLNEWITHNALQQRWNKTIFLNMELNKTVDCYNDERPSNLAGAPQNCSASKG